MLTNHVGCHYVVTSVTFYHSALVDLTRSRSVHAVEHDPCCPDPTQLSASECRAVHHGLCSPLLKLPAFSVPPPPPSPKMSGAVQPKSDLELLDPVSLLAADLEDQLEALVNSFVAQDKVRLAARKAAENGTLGRTSPSPQINRNIGRTSPSPQANRNLSTVKKLKDDRSSDEESVCSDTSNGKKLKSPKSLFPFGDTIHKPQNSFASQFADETFERSVSPSFTIKPSPEYQQTGVKAQITKFASREKESMQNSPTNSLERRTAAPKPKPEIFTAPPPQRAPLTLDALQELLLTTDAVSQPIPTTVFQSTRLSAVPYTGALDDVKSAYFKKSPAKPGQEYVQSAVDYAKTRFQNNHRQEGQEDEKPRPLRNGHVVSDARTRWEHRRALSMEGLLVPHPKLTTAQRQHIKERCLSPTTDRHVPIRPFLTKGSVAERVLLFECCPDRALERTAAAGKAKSNLIGTWRPGGSDVHTKTQFWEVVADVDKSVSLGGAAKDKENISPRTSSLRRAARAGRRENAPIPKFYFPDGKPPSPGEVEAHLKKVAAVFAGLNEGRAAREEFGIITKACGLPLYWKLPLFLAARGENKSSVSCEAFLEFWRRVVNACHDESSKFVRVMARGTRNYLIAEDFFPMMQDVIDSHPGLAFLKDASEFHSRYIQTVIARIFYCVNRSWSGKITAPELRRSNYLQVLSTLEEEEDINQITEYFSYEHFYVIYCKFWELDKDHDLLIDQNDLKLHNGGALSAKIIERIFSGAVTRGPVQKEGKMTYAEFVWFLISEEDKRHPRSIEYWFRCMDMDGDGFLSMYELEYFYQEQLQRLEALGIETLPFNDCLCQMLDIIKPKVPGKISLADLKRCKMTPIFFDTFFNLEKYLDHEQRDPFASQREHDGEGPETSDWDRYAAEEYELLVAEEGTAEQQDELIFEEYEEDDLPRKLEKVSSPAKSGVRPRQPDTEDDEYDYADSDDYHY